MLASSNLENEIQGTWWLLSREDRNSEGQIKIDPILGRDPIAILVYAGRHFAAQFMKRNREADAISVASAAGSNNTAAVGGYDAYFGTFRMDAASGQGEHTLIGSINPKNIGITVLRKLTIEQGRLVIRLDTTSAEGEGVTRTLTWNRIK